MQNKQNLPAFISVIVMLLGMYDLLRGFMHTFMLNYSAINVAGLNLATSQAPDLLQLLGAFGISNYLSGIMLILMAWKARPLALIMLGVIPSIYFIGSLAIEANVQAYAISTAKWGGKKYMLIYLLICTATFIAGTIVTVYRKKIKTAQ